MGRGQGQELDTRKVVRAAIYARYSSDMQSPESANDQIDRIKFYVESGRINLVKYPSSNFRIEFPPELIFKDEAETGRIASREGFEAYIRCIDDGLAEASFNCDLSRTLRSLGKTDKYYRKVKHRGHEVYSLCDGLSSESANAKILFQVKGLVNELGNDIHAQRTKRGQEARVLKGYSTGDICHGYYSKATQVRYIGDREVPSHYKIYIDPVQAKHIVEIFQLYASGMGKAAIAKEFNKRRIPSSTRGKKITGREVNWSSTTIGKILLRKKYIGIWEWGKTSRVINPDTEKFEKRDLPKDTWISHNGKSEIREDLAIVPIELWNKVQARLSVTREKFKKSRERIQVVREIKQIGSKSGTLLAGVLRCGECGSPMLQITGQKGGYYGCYMNHRKDKDRCKNNRLMSRKKAEKKVCDLVKSVLLTPAYLESSTKRINETIKARLRVAPEEVRALELRRRDAERELSNLLKFVATHGDTSSTIKEALAEKEQQLLSHTGRIQSLKSANVDKLLLTPFALKAKFENLFDCFERDPVIANTHLKQLFPQGLKCIARRKTLKKNHNQNNSSWTVDGCMVVDEFLNIPRVNLIATEEGVLTKIAMIEGQV